MVNKMDAEDINRTMGMIVRGNKDKLQELVEDIAKGDNTYLVYFTMSPEKLYVTENEPEESDKYATKE